MLYYGYKVRTEIEENAIATLQQNNTHTMKPIMSPQLERECLSAVQQYTQQKTWRDWGLTYLRTQGAAILLYGPAGTGKTAIAHYLGSLVKKPIVEISMADIGGGKPGDTERAARHAFEEANIGKKTVFLDEADSFLYDRTTIVGESKYMIGVINELLRSIAKHKGLVVIATNMPDKLDPALDRRLIAKVHVTRPELPERKRLWIQKMPAKFPLKLATLQIEELAEIALTGAEIETAIIREASMAILDKRQPTYISLQQQAHNEYETKYINTKEI